MNLREQISGDIKAAMKAADSVRTMVLRGIISSFNNKAIEKRSKSYSAGSSQAGKEEMLTHEEMLQVLMSEAKKRKDAIDLFKQGAREDLAVKEAAELSIIQLYLPKQLSETEIKTAVETIIVKASAKEFGPVMREVMKELKGKADSALVTKYVKETLGA